MLDDIDRRNELAYQIVVAIQDRSAPELIDALAEVYPAMKPGIEELKEHYAERQ